MCSLAEVKFNRIIYFSFYLLSTSSSFTNSTVPSNCVVDYCRLWRWPDLANENHLKPVNHCRHAFHYHANQICINPFHYDIVPCKLTRSTNIQDFLFSLFQQHFPSVSHTFYQNRILVEPIIFQHLSLPIQCQRMRSINCHSMIH